MILQPVRPACRDVRCRYVDSYSETSLKILSSLASYGASYGEEPESPIYIVEISS